MIDQTEQADIPEHTDATTEQPGITEQPGTTAGTAEQMATASLASQYEGTPYGLNEEAAALDTRARHWMAEAGFEREMGTSMLSQIHRYEQSRAGMPPLTENDAQLAMRTSAATLRHLWGEDNFSEHMDLARGLVQNIEAKRPGFTEYLANSGLWNDPLFVSSLVFQAKRLLEAKGGQQ